jgi:hypothetical protein
VAQFSTTKCEHKLMSIRPDVAVDDVSDLFVSGNVQFGSVDDGSLGIYQALLESSDASVGLTVTSAGDQVSMIVSAGYLNESVVHLREKAPDAVSFDSDLQLLHNVRREVQQILVTDGNVTYYEDGDTAMFQSLVVRNDHDLLTVDVDTTIEGAISGNLKLDGQAQFCDHNAESVCTVAVLRG